VTADYRSSSKPGHSARRALRLGLLLAAVAVTALFCWLGAWQYGRGIEKGALQVQASEVLTARAPVALTYASDESRRKELDWAAGAGWLEPRYLLLDNQRRGDRIGVRAYRVLSFDGVQPDVGQPLLVDLGWLPMDGNRVLPTLPPSTRTQVELRGLLAPPPSTGIPMGSGLQMLPDGNVLLTRLDLEAIGKTLGLSTPLAPRVLRLDPAIDTLGFERDLEVLPNTLPPERHFGYAVQWFALAATVAIVYVVLAWRARRRKENP
jgi:surfeit locus 1 family protein